MNTEKRIHKIIVTTALTFLVLAAFTTVGSAAILSEGFETSVPPTGWTEEIVNDPGADPDWSQVASGSYPTCSPHEGSYMAKFNSYNCPSDASARLYTSEMSFSGLSGVEVKFWMYHDDGYSAKNERITVQGSTDGSTWTDLATFNRYNAAGDFWGEHTVDLSAYNNENSVWIAFLGISDYGNNMYIDDVDISPLEIEKMVYNGTDWVGEISDSVPDTTYRFRINVTAKNCNFTDIVVKDTLPSCLTYEGNATPFDPNSTVGNVRYWNFSALDIGEIITIEFDVNTSEYSGCNVANVTADADTGETHSAEDDACFDTGIVTVHPTDSEANYATIGAAIAAASDGDSIEVWNSTYNENVDVNKRLTIYSRDGADVTIVDGNGDTVFDANHDYVNITGFTVTNATGSNEEGIDVYYDDHCNISYNIISGNWHGISLYSADYNVILGNVVKDNSHSGIYSGGYCNDNIIDQNTVNDNGDYGIYFYNADDNEITCNLVASNDDTGIYLKYGTTGNNISYNNIVANGVYNSGTGGWEWGLHNDQYNAITAENNYWGTDLSSKKNASINEDTGTVDSDPFLTDWSSCAPMPDFINVAKSVWDGSAWVSGISGAQPGETYRFKIAISATTYNLTNVVVNDTLSPSLSYADDASPAPSQQSGNFIQWTFSTLNVSQPETMEFNATVSYRGLDCNLANATAYCPDTGGTVSDEDTACIDSRADLEVKHMWNDHIRVNPECYGKLKYYRIIVNESNTIRVWVINNGPSNITAGEYFDVCYDLNGVNVTCVNVTGPLNASEDFYFDVQWTPNCTQIPELPNYPPMPGYPCECIKTGYNLNVTVDCNCPGCPTCAGSGRINETDEDNNRGYRAVYVCNNGYKSKNFDCNLTEDPLSLFEYDATMFGGVVYNVSGRKFYPFDAGNTSERTHHIDIPAGMTVKKARLFVYWYDYFYNPVPGCLANLSVNFSGTVFTTPNASYNDQKCLGSYNTPKGTYAYNVTSLVAGSGDYVVNVTNVDPANWTTLLGEMLLVVYEDPAQNPNNRIQLWLMEGCDLLMASHGSYTYCVDVNESTATVTFQGTIDVANVSSAELITVVSQGMEPGSNMLFNGSIIKTDAWNASSEAGPKSDGVDGSRINVEVVDVTNNVTASDNTLGFQDTGTAGMQPSNAILVVKCEGEAPTEPDLNVTGKFEEWVNATHFNINYTVCNIGTANAGACNTTIFINGTAVTEDPVPTLTAGESYTNTVGPFNCPCNQTLNITVCADNDDVVDESDEANNCRENELECLPCPPTPTPPAPTVLKPNGGEEIPGNSVYDIKWSVTKGTHDLAANPINISYSTNGGATWAPIATNEPNDGKYSWTVPNLDSSNCLVKVDARDDHNKIGSDTSGSTFTIKETTSTVEEDIPGGEEKEIKEPNSNTTVKIKTKAGEPVTATVAYYEDNPHPEAPKPAEMMEKYIDVAVSDKDSVEWPIYVEMHYTDAEIPERVDESTLGLYYFKDDEWHRCIDTDVNIAENYVWANLQESEYTGVPLNPGGSPPPVPVPEFSPLGLVALIGVLSVLLAVTSIGGRRKR